MFEQQYPHLMEPLRLRGVTVRNRIMSAPNMLFQTIGGRTTEYYTRYLEAKARGEEIKPEKYYLGPDMFDYIESLQED